MCYRFGIFEFDRSTGELRKAGVLVALEAQPAKALGMLLARGGELVTKEELKREIWGDETHVDFDRGIAYCLSEIRAVLQDSGTNPRFIQTIPKQGYRIIAPIQRVDVNRRRILQSGVALVAGSGAVWLANRLMQNRGPAVLGVSIFDNETGLAELDRWVASLSDVVVASLSAIDPAQVQVIGNAEVLRRPRNIRQLKNLAQELKANYVVLGQLQNEGNGLRFVTHLIRLSDGVHLKANRIYWPDRNVTSLEPHVVGEFNRMVQKHLLQPPKA